ncbi:hypothetical protein [Sporosarcina sp. USHLN248]|uniref:hypothetical protein n=1 Tax=Sporosarcina sp. USHLN248 TaxID=3081300 RepID=UPI003015C228
MGYLLPIQPIQSEIYANRTIGEEKQTNFAYINRVRKVNLSPQMMEEFDKKLQYEQQRIGEQRNRATTSSMPPYQKGFIHPNPANLSNRIARIVGKGMVVNEYI